MTVRLAASPRVSILIGAGLMAIVTTMVAFKLTHPPTVSHSTQAQLFPDIGIPELDISEVQNTPPAIDLEPSTPSSKITIEKELSPIIEPESIPLPAPPIVAHQIQILACNDISPTSANLRIGPGGQQIGVIGHGDWVQILGEQSGNYYPIRAEQYWVGNQLIPSPINGWIHECFR
ncbi:MAG: SH3 domain-containing protein [Cyanothece sp. SIO2G6]|nr:SH3 domain-containing protein [Cyanothece sp. SIO2G6]